MTTAWYCVELTHGLGKKNMAGLRRSWLETPGRRFLFVAEKSSVVVDGGWRAKVVYPCFMANLNDEGYAQISSCMRKAAEEYVVSKRQKSKK
jgi:hypothetical protein